MAEQETLERTREDERKGLSPSTQAGEFVCEEIEHIREGKHGARSPEQPIAIGLSKARRSDASNRLERGRALSVAYSNGKVANLPREKRFRDKPSEPHMRVARDRVRLLQERQRELADGGVKMAKEKSSNRARKAQALVSKVCLCTAKEAVWNEQAKKRKMFLWDR